MTKAEDPCFPLGERTVVSLAAQFFAPDYAPRMTQREWREEQKRDEAIGKILSLMEKGSLFEFKGGWDQNPEFLNYLKMRKSLVVIDGLLRRKVQLKHHQTEINQFVLPPAYRKRVVLACHDEMGHLGMDRTLLLLQDRVYWPGMSKDVRDHIRTCDRCERAKDREDKEEIEQTEASYPLEMVHVDLLLIGGKKDVRKDINVLVVTDHFTRYAQAYLISSQTALEVAKKLYTNFFTNYGWPTKLITDQGPQFEGRLFQQLMREAEIRKIRTTPYHPEGNAQCERFNRTLLNMLRTMPPECKGEWQEWVSSMTHAYNCTVSKTTGFGPYRLMFGRDLRIPIDNELELPSGREAATAQTYVERLKQKLQWAFDIAQQNIRKDMAARKKYHDKMIRCHEVIENDLVLLRDKKPGSNYKIADKWVDGVYEVVEKRKDGPVFRLHPVGGGVEQIVHRNMIHPARSVI